MKILLTITFTLLLSACANFYPDYDKKPGTPTPEQTRILWHEHKEAMSFITNWQLQARVAIHAGEEGGTVTLNWVERGSDHYEIELYGTLGQGRTKIISTPERVRLLTPEGPEWVAPNAEDLLAEYTGWYLPIEHLYYWVRGLPSPKSPSHPKLTPEGRLQSLTQDGWMVTYQEYMHVYGLWLPERLTLEYPGDAKHPPITVKWINKNWNL